MARTFRGRYSARIEGDFVVFLIGMRINRPWKVQRWWPVAAAMRPMLKELEDDPDSGLLHVRQALIGGPAAIQYWRSFEHLGAGPATPTRRTSPPGTSSTGGSARRGTSASGTRPTW